jgi:hypothetical protein
MTKTAKKSLRLKLNLTKSRINRSRDKEKLKFQNSKFVKTANSVRNIADMTIAIDKKWERTLLISAMLMFNIISTNKNKTAMAPT